MSDVMGSLIILVYRCVVGFLFIQKGAAKVVAGAPMWIWLGQKMAYFGITSNPLFWGLCCTVAELGGGILLVLGLGTRIATVVLLGNMTVAFAYHYYEAPAWEQIRLAVGMTAGLLLLLAYGAGRFSLDHYIKTKCQSSEVVQWLFR